MQKTITMNVPRNGLAAGKARPEFKTTGFVGDTCKNASEFLVNALGTVVSDVATSGEDEPDQFERLRHG